MAPSPPFRSCRPTPPAAATAAPSRVQSSASLSVQLRSLLVDLPLLAGSLDLQDRRRLAEAAAWVDQRVFSNLEEAAAAVSP